MIRYDTPLEQALAANAAARKAQELEQANREYVKERNTETYVLRYLKALLRPVGWEPEFTNEP